MFTSIISSKNIKLILDSLEKHPTLTALSFQRCTVTKKSMQAFINILNKNTTLKSLNLSQTQLTPENIVEIAHSLKENQALEELNFKGITIRDPQIIEDIINVTLNYLHLKTVRLSYDEDNKTASYLVAIILRLISLSEASKVEIFAYIGGISIDLLNIKKLIKQAPKFPNVSTLEYSSNSLYPSIDEFTTEPDKPSVLFYKPYNSAIGTPKQANYLAAFILANPSITKVDLSNCTSCNHYIIKIMISLLGSHKLHTLNLSETNLSDPFAYFLHEFLKRDRTLKVVNISNNHFTQDGIYEIIRSLRYNATLVELNIFQKNFKQLNCEVLQDFLTKNLTLIHLNLFNKNEFSYKLSHDEKHTLVWSFRKTLKDRFKQTVICTKEILNCIKNKQSINFKYNARTIFTIEAHLNYYISQNLELNYSNKIPLTDDKKSNYKQILNTLWEHQTLKVILVHRICKSCPPKPSDPAVFCLFEKLPIELTGLIFQWVDLNRVVYEAIKRLIQPNNYQGITL